MTAPVLACGSCVAEGTPRTQTPIIFNNVCCSGSVSAAVGGAAGAASVGGSPTESTGGVGGRASAGGGAPGAVGAASDAKPPDHCCCEQYRSSARLIAELGLVALAALAVFAWACFIRAAKTKSTTTIYKHPPYITSANADTMAGDPPERERIEKSDLYSSGALGASTTVLAVVLLFLAVGLVYLASRQR